MRIARFTHSCVRLEADDGGTLVIDPGVWTEEEALVGAGAILVTHEHVDHIDVLRLAQLGLSVHAPATARIDGVDVIGIAPGDELTIAGFRIRAVGGRHAFIYAGQPDCANLGYIVDGALYHPGDSVHVPEGSIETLLVPMQGSWLKTEEAIDFVQAVRPSRAFGIHDGQLNERGLNGINAWLTRESGTDYRWLRPGETA